MNCPSKEDYNNELHNVTILSDEYVKYNTRQFIKEMQCRPCLWNINLPEYNDRVTREYAWIEIAQIMYDEWDELNPNDKAEKVKDLQKKWKGLRDYHTRVQNKKYIPKNNTSELASGRKRPFLDMLYFLNDKKKGNTAAQTQKAAETDSGSKSNSILVHKKPKASLLKARTAVPKATSPEIDRQPTDPDANFLFSILPDMKSMNPSQNFEFRFHVMKLIKDIKYNEPNSDYYVNCEPGRSGFETQGSKYKTTIIPEQEMDILDPISNESAVSSPEDRKIIIHESE